MIARRASAGLVAAASLLVLMVPIRRARAAAPEDTAVCLDEEVRDFLIPQEVLGRGRSTNNISILGGFSLWLG